MIETIGQAIITAGVGGLVTAGGGIIYMRVQMEKLKTQVGNVKENCTTCRKDVEKNLDSIHTSINQHHSDADKHNTKSSTSMLEDILKRVTRIEDRMINGSGKKG